MPINVGNTVHIEGCILGEGIHVLEGVVTEKNDDEIVISVAHKITRGILKEFIAELHIAADRESHLERPIRQRLIELQEQWDAMIAYFP